MPEYYASERLFCFLEFLLRFSRLQTAGHTGKMPVLLSRREREARLSRRVLVTV